MFKYDEGEVSMRGSVWFGGLLFTCLVVPHAIGQQPGPLYVPGETAPVGGQELGPVDVIPVPQTPGTVVTPNTPPVYEAPGNVTYPQPNVTYPQQGPVYSRAPRGGCQSGSTSHKHSGGLFGFGWFKRSHSGHNYSSGSRGWFRSGGSCCNNQGHSRGIFGWWKR